jgi:hypothetical protein
LNGPFDFQSATENTKNAFRPNISLSNAVSYLCYELQARLRRFTGAVQRRFDSLQRFIPKMNTEPNDPEIVAALEAVKAEAAAQYKIVLNEAALNYANQEYRNIRARNPLLSPEEAVVTALNDFPFSNEGIAYLNSLIRIFLACYKAFVGRRLRWATGEGFIPIQDLEMIHWVIVDWRIARIQEDLLHFDLGNPRTTTPQTVEEQARALAQGDVDRNLERISELLKATGGAK